MAQKKYVSLSKLSTFLDNLKNKFSPITHKHTISDITDYKVDTALSSTSTNPVQNKVIDAEFEAISTAMNALDSAIDDKAASNHNHDSSYDVKGAAADALTSAQEYTDTAVGELNDGFSNVIYQMYGNDITENGAPTIRQIANDEATTAVSSKADKNHTHDDRYYTETEIDTKLAGKSDTSHKHDSLYDVKGAAAAVQTNLNEVGDTLGSHTGNTDIHVTTTNKSNWNTAYTHSQSAHARTDATKVADSTTNGNILINGTETNVYSHPNSGVTAGTYKSVTVNAQGHITAGTNPTTLAGYGITDAESKGAASTALADAKEYTDTKTSNLASTSFVNTSISSHNTSTSAHNDIRVLIDGLTTKLNNFLDVDDTTTDQLSEVITLINNNKGTLESLTTSKINVSDIVNNLTTNSTSKVLSAAQGVVIQSLIDDLQAELDGIVEITSTEIKNLFLV